MFGGEAGTLLFGHGRREVRIGRREPGGGMGLEDERPKIDIFRIAASCEFFLFFQSIACTIWNENSN
jgi:hypothetical protein